MRRQQLLTLGRRVRSVKEQRQWESWNCPYFNTQMNADKNGQALLELAIFGSILIMLLGLLINYGLRYNFQQQAMQEAFRKALKSAAEADQDGKPTSTTHILIKDRHIPNPSNPFGIGSVIPLSASASVVRNYHLQDNNPETYAELPQITLNIQGNFQGQEVSFKTAGFREENNVPEGSINRYKEIYGNNNVWVTGNGECLRWEINPVTGEEECAEHTKNIKIIDSAAGEIISYDSTVRQCRQIVDEEVCERECQRGKLPGSATDCNKICSYPINIPWYCQGAVEINPATHQYSFPVLDQLFAFATSQNKPRNMGLQSDYTQTVSMVNELNKHETTSGITSTDTLNWQVDSKRKIIYHPYGSTDPDVNEQEVTSSVSQDETKVWTTTW